MRTAAAKWLILIFWETEASTVSARKNEACRSLMFEQHVFELEHHIQASSFQVYTVEASISQKLRISHLAEAVLMVYLTCDCTTILSSLHMWCCNSNTCCSHTKNLQASFFPVNTVEAPVSQKMRISHLAAAVLMVCSTVIIALLCEFTYVMLLFKLVLFKHKKLTGLILSGEYSGGLCLRKWESAI